jgi:hypothetical protein
MKYSHSSCYNESHNDTEHHQLSHDGLFAGNHLEALHGIGALFGLRNRKIAQTAMSSDRGETGVRAFFVSIKDPDAEMVLTSNRYHCWNI